MSNLKTFNQIVNEMIDRLRLVQPSLDTKPGTVSRDLFIDIQADQIEKVYRVLNIISSKQSLATSTGSDLDRLSRNFSISRRLGSSASGTVIFTVNSLNSDIQIPSGTIVQTRGGIQFRVVNDHAMKSSESSALRSNASKFRSELFNAGVSNQFALEVPVEATSAGLSGNIGSYQITSTSLSDNVVVTNISSFAGGTNLESDSSFRSRILGIFSGANIGTEDGYKNQCLAVQGVSDVLIAGPGDSLMIRDGSEIYTYEDGSTNIVSQGSGGKVDVYVLGVSNSETVENYTFRNRSSDGDISSDINDIVLGQISSLSNLTIDEAKRAAFLNNLIPLQPVSSIVSVIGSESGELSEESLLDDGTIFGNYKLVKDLSEETRGTIFAKDRIKFISSKKYVSGESISKSLDNQIVKTNFSDIDNLYNIYYDSTISSENSNISQKNNSILKLKHDYVSNIISAKNLTTGETYSISSSNPQIIEDGLVEISGRSLPSASDILSLSYVNRIYFDKFIDYFTALESSSVSKGFVDWGKSSSVEREVALLEESPNSERYVVSSKRPIDRLIDVYYLYEETVSVEYIGSSLGVTLDNDIENVVSVTKSVGGENYHTDTSDGSFEKRSVIFPSDSGLKEGDEVFVKYNKFSFINVKNSDSSFDGREITLPSNSLFSEEELNFANSVFLQNITIYIDYICKKINSFSDVDLSSLPINNLDSQNTLSDSFGSEISNSSQPVTKRFSGLGDEIEVELFAPSRLMFDVRSNIDTGRLRVSGDVYKRINAELEYGVDFSSELIDLSKYILNYFENIEDCEILSVDEISYDDGSLEKVHILNNSTIKNNFYNKKLISDTSISPTSVKIPLSKINKIIGKKHIISFSVKCSNISEDLYFSINDSRYTENIFLNIESIRITSGFKRNGQYNGNVSCSFLNQPTNGSSFFADYDFLAPKEGENITVAYNYNKIIQDCSLSVNNKRIVGSDILVKEALYTEVDVSADIVISDDYISSSESLRLECISAINTLISSGGLEQKIDYSDIMKAITNVVGIDSAYVTLFNKSNNFGRKTFLKALKNETFISGKISINIKTKQNFRIV